MSLIEITPFQLLLCLLFVLVAGAGSVAFKLRLEKDLAWGTVRTFAQLFLMGYILKYIFQINNAYLIVLLFAFITAFQVQGPEAAEDEDAAGGPEDIDFGGIPAGCLDIDGCGL